MYDYLPVDDGRWVLDTASCRGLSNGLPALRWAPMLEVSGTLVARLLGALRERAVPARAEPRTWQGAPVGDRWRLWVDALAYARAEDIIRAELSAEPST